GKALSVHGSAAGKTLKIQLEHCASATIRFLDPDGKPVRGHSPNVHQIITTGIHEFVAFSNQKLDEPFADADFIGTRHPHHPWDEMRGEDGRITLRALIHGATYQLFDWNGNKAFVAHELKLQPGQQIDLPDMTLRGDDILRAAEENWLKHNKL